MAGADNPLAQFEIQYLSHFPEVMGLNFNYSNSSLFMTLTVILVTSLFAMGLRERALIPGRLQCFVELLYEFISDMVKENVGDKGRQYFPLIFTLFLFILGCNLLGMMPYGFTVTSHIAVTFALAMFIFFMVTIIALVKHGMKFFSFFLPHGTPWWLAPLMVFIELFAYLARPVSLSIRLAANMMAGHTMLKVIAGFVVTMGLLGVFPLLFLVVLSGFEVFVAILQAYIFAVLTCVYLNDAIHLH